MEAADALAKINDIHRVIEGSNKAIFSGKRMILNGALVCLIPMIEILSDGLTFGRNFGQNTGMIMALSHTIFYWLMFSIANQLMSTKSATGNQQHPLIKKAFGIGRPVVVAIFGMVYVLSYVGEPQLIHPIVLVLLGLLFNLYGRFTIPVVNIISWSYIILGLLYGALSKIAIPNLWIYMSLYNGLTYILMGVLLKREQKEI